MLNQILTMFDITAKLFQYNVQKVFHFNHLLVLKVFRKGISWRKFHNNIKNLR